MTRLLSNLVLSILALGAVTACAPVTAELRSGACNGIQEENVRLRERVRQLETSPALTIDSLSQKRFQRLQDLARETRAQRAAMADFAGFVTWMTDSLAGYKRYVEAGSVAAGFARLLPIPYAGQAGLFAKFVSHFALSLSESSAAINRYSANSQLFLKQVDALGSSPEGKGPEIAELSRFVDTQLLKDMADVRTKLGTTAELSASTLSFLEGLHQYLGTGDEYFAKTKAFLTRKDEKVDKGYLTASIEGLKGRAGGFNAKLKGFDESARRSSPLIQSLSAYDELMRELEKTQSNS